MRKKVRGKINKIDTTIVSPLTRQAAPRQHGGQYAGTALRDARRSKERTYPELVQPGRCRLVVFGVETGGRWSAAEPARALNPCAKPSRLPSSPDGPPSLLMPPSPPLPQACYARTHHPTTTWMASSHHVANSSPTCHESPLPPGKPQPPLKEHGLDLATPPSPSLETDK